MSEIDRVYGIGPDGDAFIVTGSARLMNDATPRRIWTARGFDAVVEPHELVRVDEGGVRVWPANHAETLRAAIEEPWFFGRPLPPVPDVVVNGPPRVEWKP